MLLVQRLILSGAIIVHVGFILVLILLLPIIPVALVIIMVMKKLGNIYVPLSIITNYILTHYPESKAHDSYYLIPRRTIIWRRNNLNYTFVIYTYNFFPNLFIRAQRAGDIPHSRFSLRVKRKNTFYKNVPAIASNIERSFKIASNNPAVALSYLREVNDSISNVFNWGFHLLKIKRGRITIFRALHKEIEKISIQMIEEIMKDLEHLIEKLPQV
jgi:hypothetical protein